MSNELHHLDADLLGQLRKIQDYQFSLEAQNSELTLQNDSLEANTTTLRIAMNKVIKQQSELTIQNDALQAQNQALLGQLSDVKTYQSELMKQNKELLSVNTGLLQTQEKLQTANQSLEASIRALQSEQEQPPALLMTTYDEKELLDLIDSKDKLIETLKKTVTEMRESLSILNI